MRISNQTKWIDSRENGISIPESDAVLDTAFCRKRRAGFCRKAAVCFLILAVGVALAGTRTVTAASASYTNSDTGFEAVISDEAELISSSGEEELLEHMTPITAYGNVGFVSIDENPEYSTAYYASSCYFELFGAESGTIFLIDMDEREIYIYSYGSVYDVITDAKADTITDNIYKLASNGDYAGCAEEAFDEINTLLGGDKIAQPMKYISNALLAILIALLLNFIFISRVCRVRTRGSSRLIGGADANISFNDPDVQFTHQTRRYVPRDHDSGGGGGGGGGSSGGGGGGGGGGGHSF